MSKTDSPLKILLNEFSHDIAAWLLNCAVNHVKLLNVDLPGEDLSIDQAFQVQQADGQQVILHTEFQGRSSHKPMAWRMLSYISRLAEKYRLPVCSVVIYVGQGAGRTDTGEYQVAGHQKHNALTWHYQVIRLWELSAEALLASPSPGLWPLIGQSRIEQPEILFPQLLAKTKTLPDTATQARILSLVASLLDSQEMMDMLENAIENEPLLSNTPFLLKIRSQGREEGREEGRTENALDMLLDAIQFRFQPDADLSAQLKQRLQSVRDVERYKQLLHLTMSAETLQSLLEHLSKES